MQKSDVVRILIPKNEFKPKEDSAAAFAPTNIALCKYWGKRDNELNLPFNSSLSIALKEKGAETRVAINNLYFDRVTLNNQIISASSVFAARIKDFLDLFRGDKKIYFDIETHSNIPIASGIASSACGFAALVKALNKLFAWDLDSKSLCILARLGSGSACRSFWEGFVEWHAGSAADGMDSYAEPLLENWQQLQVGLLIISAAEKSISSREAMLRTVESSPFYSCWLTKVKEDLNQIKNAIFKRDFNGLGKLTEANALAMHATLQTAWPPVNFSQPRTLAIIQKIWDLRQSGLELFFTQDAGPNLKLLFLSKDTATICKIFPEMEVISPFGGV